MLFQGQEFLEDEWFRDDVPLDWERAEQFRDIVRLARDLIHLRRNADGISRGPARRRLRGAAPRRRGQDRSPGRAPPGDDVAVVVVNASAEPRDVTTGMPSAGPWAVRFNSDASTYSALFAGHETHDVDAVDEPRRRPAGERHRLGRRLHARRAHSGLSAASGPLPQGRCPLAPWLSAAGRRARAARARDR